MTHSTTGSCWYIVQGGNTVMMTVIDHSDSAWVTSESGMNSLTCAGFLTLLSGLFADAYCSNGQAESRGVIGVTPVQVDRSLCGT